MQSSAMTTAISEIAEKFLSGNGRGRSIRRVFSTIMTSKTPLKFAAAILRRQANKCKDIRDYVHLVLHFFDSFPFRMWSIIPAQLEDEIAGLLMLLSRHKPAFILEIGTFRGGTLFLFARVADQDATIISVDLPYGQFGGGYPQWRTSLYESFATRRQQIHLIRQDSHAARTLVTVESILKGRKLDFLFIDGDHAYQGVREDFNMYSPLVRDGGVIAFHDIAQHPLQTECRVNEFWSEIKDQYNRYVEIIHDKSQQGMGIGVLYV